MNEMNEEIDNDMERILNGQPQLAHTLAQVEQEAARRAVGTTIDHIVCMGTGAELCIRVAEDYCEEEDTLTALVWCYADGRRQNIEQEK